MKKKLKKLLPALRTAAWITAALFLFIITGAAISHQNNTPLKEYNISVDHQNGLYFVNEDDVKQLLQDNNYEAMVNKPIEAVDYSRLEAILQNNPYVSKADIYVNTLGDVEVHVKQRIPILRVINNNGVSFYIDETGNKMPASNRFTARIPVATGNISDKGLNEDFSDSATMKKLYHLASYISNDSLLSALVEQIYVNENHEFVLVPKVGDHVIEIGDDNDLSEKFNKLFAFYRSGLDNVGWQQYSVVNLKYRNQVFATRRGAVKTPSQPLPTFTTINTTNQPLNTKPNGQ